MRALREVMRMYREGCLPVREIARLSGVARSTVRDMLARFERSGLSWPVPAGISDAELEARLYGPAGVKPGRRKQAEPDWSVVARELKRKHVTLQVLWEEYIAAHPEGYRYSRWCELFRSWEGRLSLVMRQSHAGGEKLFVDYAGDTVPVVINRRTGEIRDAHLFVAVLGGSSLSFACATWTEQFTALRAGSTAGCSKCCSRATGSPPTRTARLSGQRGSAKVGLPVQSATRLAGTIARCSTPAYRA